MEKTIQKYTERLATLKENRARTIDTNTDAENELYDQLIKQVAEFIRDTKQLNILCVSGSCFWRHKWGEWKQFKQIMTHVKHGGTFVEMWQQRECKNCGKVQQEYISG